MNRPAVLDGARVRTPQAISNPLATPSTYHEASTTARAGRTLLDGQQADKSNVSGGPSNQAAPMAMQIAFKIDARTAGGGAARPLSDRKADAPVTCAGCLD